MAQSPSHRFGQYLGNVLEEVTVPELEAFCHANGLYLDKHGARPGVRNGKKATWTDDYGNSHDLDFVIEVDGTLETQGRPLAFIECAWRRYTKHSRNKAQEIQGAILPLVEKHYKDVPFKGAILAGEFTLGSLNQLESLGFEILYITYDDYCRSFERHGVDISFDEKTTDASFDDRLAQIAHLGVAFQRSVVSDIRESNRQQIDDFISKISGKLTRTVSLISIIPLFGSEHEFTQISEALDFLTKSQDFQVNGPFRHIEILCKYSNGDRVDGTFQSPEEAARFLRYVAKV